MPTDPKEIVRTGYDRVSHAYRADKPDEKLQSQYSEWIATLTESIPPGGKILDLGCGNGIPTAQLLSDQYAVTGIDLSPVQIERARLLVPKAHFLCADMTQLEFNPATFDAVICFYSLIHVPLEEQPALLAKIAQWLRPGGLLLATVGFDDWTGTEKNWLGVEGGTMYWSHPDEATYLQWLQAAGFQIRWHRFIPERITEGHTLILAKKEPSELKISRG